MISARVCCCPQPRRLCATRRCCSATCCRQAARETLRLTLGHAVPRPMPPQQTCWRGC